MKLTHKILIQILYYVVGIGLIIGTYLIADNYAPEHTAFFISFISVFIIDRTAGKALRRWLWDWNY